MNRHIIFRSLYIVVIFFISVLIISCTKEPDTIGLDVQPPSDRLGTEFTDTTQILAFSVLEDTITTNTLSQNVVGWLNDPFFGKTKASLVTQFNLPSRDVHFDGNPVVDSAVLVISYRGFYGDTTAGVNFKVYEVAENLSADVSYHQNQTIQTYQKALNYYPNQYQTTQVSSPIYSATDTVNPAFRIRLNTNWARQKFIDKSGDPEIASNDNFKSYFKGLMITADDARGLGHLAYLGINKSTTSGVYIYYHTNDTVSQTFRLLVEDDCVRANLYDHANYYGANSQIRNQVVFKDSSLGMNQLYLHPGGGINTKIKFPTVREQFKNRRVVINRAELVITNLVPNQKGFYVPLRLTIAKNSSTGTYQFIPDDAITEGEDYFGGVFNQSTNEYRFRITRYIQQLINSTTDDYGLTLFISGRAVVGNRLIFAGNKPNILTSRAKPLRLEVSFTYLD